MRLSVADEISDPFHQNNLAAIQPGAFQYDSPRPPDGAHTYEWTAEAVSGDGKSLGESGL